MTCTHPKYELPNDPHAKYRYESAMKHVEAAKAAGKSTEEIHAIFKKVMEFDPKNIDAIPNDEAHAKYRSAMIHMQKALANGKSVAEAHEIFEKIKSGNTSGHCKKWEKTQVLKIKTCVFLLFGDNFEKYFINIFAGVVVVKVIFDGEDINISIHF